MRLDLDRVRENVRKATDEDLLDRATVYREGMEPEALAIIDAELRARGINAADIERHEQERGEVILTPEGIAARCSFCHQPAVAQGWGWHRLWKVLPLFPRVYRYCSEHRPAAL